MKLTSALRIPTLADGLKAVLFDAGNTLIHVDWVEIGHVLASLGHRVPSDALRRSEYAGRKAANAMLRRDAASTDRSRSHVYFGAALADVSILGTDAAHAVEALIARHEEVGIWRVVIEGTLEAIERLCAAGIQVAVVSNADGRVERYLRDAGLLSRFMLVIDSHIVGVEKPDPRIFQMALDRLGTHGSAALYAGDLYEVDVVGARRAGLFPVLMDPLMSDEYDDVARVRNVADLADQVLDGPRAA